MQMIVRFRFAYLVVKRYDALTKRRVTRGRY